MGTSGSRKTATAVPSDDMSPPRASSRKRLSQPRRIHSSPWRDHPPESLHTLPWTDGVARAASPDHALCCVRHGTKRSISCYQFAHRQGDDEMVVECEDMGHLTDHGREFGRGGVFDGKLVVTLRGMRQYVSLHDVLNGNYSGTSCSPKTKITPADPVVEALCPLEALSETTRAGQIRGGSVTNVSACRLLFGNYSRELDIVHAQTFKVVHSIETVKVVSMRHFPRVSSDNFYIGRGGTKRAELGAVCWNLEKGKETMTFYGTNKNLTYGLDVDVGRSLLYTGDCSGVLAVWDYRTGKNTTKRCFRSGVKRIMVDEPRHFVLVCIAGGAICMLDVRKPSTSLGVTLNTPIGQDLIELFRQPTRVGEKKHPTYVAVYQTGPVCRFDPGRPGSVVLKTKFGAADDFGPSWACSSAQFVCRGDHVEDLDEAVLPMREFVEFVSGDDGICSAVRDAVFCRIAIQAGAGEKTLMFRSMLV